jgi:flagellar biosynthesis protein FlhB
MNNIIIEKMSTSRYFNYKPLPLPGEYMPIPSSLPGYLFQAEIQYQFNQLEYKTLPNFIEKIRRSDVAIISKNEFIVGLRYDKKEMYAPIILFKEKYTKNSMQLCKENYTPIKYNKPLARYLYHDCTPGSEIPGDIYEVVAVVFAQIIKNRGDPA